MSQRPADDHPRPDSARAAPLTSRTGSRKAAKGSKRRGGSRARQRSSRLAGSRDFDADSVSFSSLRASAAGKTIFAFLGGPSLAAMLATSRGWRGYVLRHCRHFHIESPPLASSSLLASAARSALAFEQLDHIALPVGYMPLGDTALLGPCEATAHTNGDRVPPLIPAKADGARRWLPAYPLSAAPPAQLSPTPCATLTHRTHCIRSRIDVGVPQLRVRQRCGLPRVRRVRRPAAAARLGEVARTGRGGAAPGRRGRPRRRHGDRVRPVGRARGPLPPAAQHRHLRLHNRRRQLCGRRGGAPGPLSALPAPRGQPASQRASAPLHPAASSHPHVRADAVAGGTAPRDAVRGRVLTAAVPVSDLPLPARPLRGQGTPARRRNRPTTSPAPRRRHWTQGMRQPCWARSPLCACSA